MTVLHPARGGITKKLKAQASSDDTINALTITVPSDQYGVLYTLLVDVDVGSEADLENLPANLVIQVNFNAVIIWVWALHPLIAHDDATNFFRQVDLGPWFWNFGEDGLYKGVKGHNLGVTVSAAGTGIKTTINIQYAGD